MTGNGNGGVVPRRVGVVAELLQFDGGTRRNTAEHGRTRRNTAEHGRTRQNTAEHGRTRQNTAEHGGTWRDRVILSVVMQ